MVISNLLFKQNEIVLLFYFTIDKESHSIYNLLKAVVKMMDKEYRFEGNRVFIDVGTGCGNACLYCYDSMSHLTQSLFTEERIADCLREISLSSSFVAGQNGTIISLSPSTEPLLTEESSRLTLMIVLFFLPFKNLIQISTKSLISQEFLDTIDRAMLYPNQVVIFVSTSSMHNSFEPNVLSIFERLKNFELLSKSRIGSCLYLKPFLLKTDEFEMVYSILDRVQIDAICAGVYYDNSQSGLLSHPAYPNLHSVGKSDYLRSFIQMYDNRVPLFNASTCVLAYLNGIKNPFYIHGEICANCYLRCHFEQ